MAFPASTPHTSQVPSHLLGLVGAAFSGPHPLRTIQALVLGLYGTKLSLSAVAQDTCVVHTQALMMSKACLSQSPSSAPVLGIPATVCPGQRPSSCASPSLHLWRPGASGVHPFDLPSHIGEGSCRGLIPMGTGAIESGPPSLPLSEELVSLAGSVGQEAPWQQQGQSTTLMQEALGLNRDPGSQKSQFSANHRAAPQCF